MSAPVVYVVDDDPSVRKALSRLFRSAELRVEAFETAEAFLAHERADAPGCLVLDVRMPGRSGLELLEERAAHDLSLPVIVLTGHGDIPMSVRAMKGGATDFLPKPVPNEELLEAVLAAVEADTRRRVETAGLEAFRRRLEDLTPRERDVIELVVAGRLNKQVALELGITLYTVKVHRGRAMKKTGVDSVAELARLWERAGLPGPG